MKDAMNFTWWVNRKDRFGKNVFEGGFLGLDNIGVFDRSAPLPTGGSLEQADGTAWMALFSQNMLELAFEVAMHDPSYEPMRLSASYIPQIVQAMEVRPRIPVIWLHGLECTCCSESFIRSSHPIAQDIILNMISLDYDDTLQAAAGFQVEEIRRKLIKDHPGGYLLAVDHKRAKSGEVLDVFKHTAYQHGPNGVSE